MATYTAGPHTSTNGTSGDIDTTGMGIIWIGQLTFGAPAGPPSDNLSNTWNNVRQVNDGTWWLTLYRASPAIVSATHHFIVGGGSFELIAVLSASGSATSPDDQFASSTTNKPGSVTPTEDNEMLVSIVFSAQSGIPFSVDSGFTKVEQIETLSFFDLGLAYKIQTTATTEDITWTCQSSADSIIGTFKAASAAAGRRFFLIPGR